MQRTSQSRRGNLRTICEHKKGSDKSLDRHYITPKRKQEERYNKKTVTLTERTVRAGDVDTAYVDGQSRDT